MKIGRTINLDHQATTPVDSRVLAEMTPYLGETLGNPHSLDHILGWQSSRVVDEAAARVARLIGADADEIIFTSGATESNNLALLGLARRACSSMRRRILISATEHKCVLAASRAIEDQLGLTIELLPVDSEGFVRASTLEESLDDDVLLVSVMAVNNEIGTIQDIEALSGIAKQYNAVFHCDAAQAPIALALDSFAQYVDLLSLSAHKMYGPKGIGAIYIARTLQDQVEPLIYGGGQQQGLRSGTLPVPLCVGMGAAAEMFTQLSATNRRDELRRMTGRFVSKLSRLPWPTSVNGPNGDVRHPGNANISFIGFSASDILAALQPRVAASTGSACTTGIPEQSHVLRAIGMKPEAAESSIRFSLGFDTTEEDIDEAVELLDKSLAKLARSGEVKSA